MKTTIAAVSVVAIILLSGAGAFLYRAGKHAGAAGAAPAAHSATEKKPLYWQDPMVPGQRFDKPGKSPYMDMALVPV